MINDVTLTVIKNGKIYQSDLDGLKPVFYFLLREPEILKDSYVIDKIVGKASAMLLIQGGVGRVHGKTMSKAADEMLTAHGIERTWDVMVDYIINRDGTDMCPMEKKVRDLHEPVEAFETLKPIFENQV
ncbi:MAG: DUF1893 domain-containing protein [Erysipelotrichaceae bacterium]|nr:DUF1893 domain-containing protein [Erysipelotrichaceae bacterium]